MLVLYSDMIRDQIDFAVLTGEMYNLCGVSSGGFCTGVCSRERNLIKYYCIYSFCYRQTHHHILLLLNNASVLEIHSLQTALV